MKTNIVHTVFRVEKYSLMSINQFRDILSLVNPKRCKKSQKDMVFVTIKCVYKFHISDHLLVLFLHFFVSHGFNFFCELQPGDFVSLQPLFQVETSCQTQVLDFLSFIFL